MIAWCTECKTNVEVFWEHEQDEDGTDVETPLCVDCQTAIKRCGLSLCRFWIPDNPNTPLGRTMGTCSRRKKRMHATDLICGYYRTSAKTP